jgi:hypothetical protein
MGVVDSFNFENKLRIEGGVRNVRTTPSGYCMLNQFPTMPFFCRRALLPGARPLQSVRQTWARPFQSIRQTWASPPPSGAPFQICQANLGAPSSQGRALFQSVRQTWARPPHRGAPFSQGRALSYQSSSVPRT